MELGNAAKSYDAYLASWAVNHAARKELNIMSMFDPEYKAIRPLFKDSVVTQITGRVYRRNPLRILNDGRVVEMSVDTSGGYIYVLFDSMAEALSYEKPMSITEYYEWW